jgi:hypothetical protein
MKQSCFSCSSFKVPHTGIYFFSVSVPSEQLEVCLEVIYKTEVKNQEVFTEIKGKASPLQALTGPEGSRRLSLPDFKTIGT